MKFNLSYIKKAIAKDVPKPLGRWAIVYCTNQINTKIDLANEDHCGPCGQYNIPKNEDNFNLSLEELEILYSANILK
jgi:hypothetical protein